MLLVHLPLPSWVRSVSGTMSSLVLALGEWYDLEATAVVSSCFSAFNDQPGETPRRHPGPSAVR
jgi:hypothetical protein